MAASVFTFEANAIPAARPLGALHVTGSSIGSRVGNYELMDYLGRGGMAEVYGARRRDPGASQNIVALKRMLPPIASDARMVELFVHEARLCSKFAHPNLPRMLDFGVSGGAPYLIFEWVEGLSCDQLLMPSNDSAWPLGAAIEVARQVLRGLAHAHSLRAPGGEPLGVVHGDISPDNIMLARSGAVVLLDFGVAHSGLSSRPYSAKELRGKPAYFSPEQVGGRTIDARSDLFAVGAILAELLLGRQLFDGRTELDIAIASFEVNLGKLSQLDEGSSAVLRPLLEKALARDPDRRFQDALAFERALAAIAVAAGVETGADALCEWSAALNMFGPTLRQAQAERTGSATQLRRRVDEVCAQLVAAAGRHPAPEPALPKSARRRRVIDPAIAAPRYSVCGADGDRVDSQTLAQLVERVVTGQSIPRVGYDGGRFMPTEAVPPFATMLRLPAYHFHDCRQRASWRADISRNTLPAVLFYLARTESTGLLMATNGLRKKRVFFDRGTPIFVASTDASELLGQRLVAAGLLSEATLEELIALACHHGRLGAELVHARILSATEMLQLLVSEIEVRVLDLGTWDEGELAFVPGMRPGLHVPRPFGSAAELAARLVRADYTDEQVASFLEPVGDAELVLALDRSSPLLLTEVERRVVYGVSGSVSSRIEASALPLGDARRAVLLAMSAGLFESHTWAPLPACR